MNKLSSLLIPLLIVTVLLAANNNPLPRAHAAAATIGLVCLADSTLPPPSSTNACPPAPVVFTGANSPNNQLRIFVSITNSDIFLGFDITLKADHTILKPADADLTGSILNSGPTINVKCIGGFLKSSAGKCDPTLDTLDTIHFSAGQGVYVAGTGLLFTATFNVTGIQTGGIPVGFQFGCGTPNPTSIGPAPNVCITMLSGAPGTPTAETYQTASFSNQPGFAISATPTNLVVKETSSSPSTIAVTSVNKFNGTVTLTTKVSPAGPVATLLQATLKVNSTTSITNSSTLTISAGNSPLGPYLANVTATSGSTILYVIINFNIVDFRITASPTSLTINAGLNDNSTVTLTSLNNYVGTISITPTVNATTGLGVTCIPTTITLDPSTNRFSGSSKCTLSPSTAGNYNVTITGSDGQISRSVFVIVKALSAGSKNFAMNTLPSSIRVPVGGSNSTTMILTSIAGLTGTVNFTATTTASGLSASPSSFSLVLLPNGANLTTLTVSATASANPFTYTVKITGIAQGLTHSILLTVVVFADFSISATPASLAVNVGSSAKSNITLTNLGNLVGIATLASQVSPSGLTTSLNSTTVDLTLATRKQVVLTINAPNGTSPGVYAVLLTAQVRSITQTVSLTVNVALHDLRIVSVSVNTASATVGGKVTFTIVVQNTGTTAENATVNALVGNLTVATASVPLKAGEAKPVILIWDTTTFAPGTYVLGGKVLSAPGEVSTSNNIDLNASTFNLTAPQTSNLSQNTLLILIIALVVIAAIILGTLLLRRRSPAQTVQ